MSKEKPAGLRLLKNEVESSTSSAKGCKKRHPSLLSILHAVMVFVGNFGRVLKFIDKVIEWWNGLS